MMCGITFPIVIAAVGISVTIAEANRAKTILQRAADTSALAAANVSSEQPAGDSKRRAIAKTIFHENMTYDDKKLDPVVTFGGTGRETEATVDASVELNLFFSGLLPRSLSTVNATSTAAMASASNHVDLFVLVDNSASMGIGQTAQDRDDMLRDPTMRSLGMEPCAVACHEPGTPSRNTYPYYKSEGVRMRIDAVADSLENFLQQVRDGQGKTRNTRVHIRTTGDLDDTITPPFHPDHDSAIARANSLELDPRPGRSGTQIARSLLHVESIAGTGGGGGSSNDTKKIVILMTDGVEHGRPTLPNFRISPNSLPDSSQVYALAKDWLNDNDPATLASLTDPDDGLITANNIYQWGVDNNYETDASKIQILDPQACQALKDNGVTVIVMNIEYGVPEFRSKADGTYPRYDDARVALQDGLRDQALFDLKPLIVPELQQCASSPDLVYSVDQEAQMTGAFEQIFSEVFDKQIVRLMK